MDAIYRDLAPDRIPWNIEHPPELLVELVESKWIQPCKAVDLGCGTGNYTLWLASKGFQMTGIDISSKAIEMAEHQARTREISCRFIKHDLLSRPGELPRAFGFAYDWEVLHHIFPKDRKTYVSNVHSILLPKGIYFSVCFSETDPDFGGEGKYRKTPIGTTLYFSSEQELRELFGLLFRIEKLYTKRIAGKYGPHEVIVALMER